MIIPLTYLEFYSGIGGWGYALEEACRTISVEYNNELVFQPQLLAAYDHSDLCNSVFYHNHINYHHQSSETVAVASSSSSSSPPSSSSNSKKRKRHLNKNKHNHQKAYKPKQTPIENLSTLPSANIWCMSPPCQPHTRQHTNQNNESNDVRSKSFQHLCELLGNELMEEELPNLILLENVIGFEQSWTIGDSDSGGADNDTGSISSINPSSSCSSATANNNKHNNNNSMGSFQTFRRALSKRQYHVSHFHLDPTTTVGIPNNRPRHYTVAYRQIVNNNKSSNDMMMSIAAAAATAATNAKAIEARARYHHLFCHEKLNEVPIIHDESSFVALTQKKKKKTRKEECLSISSFLDDPITTTTNSNSNQLQTSLLQIPKKLQGSSSSWCFDIVTPYHKCSACFTHSYGKFIRGTGSILYTGPLSLKGGGGVDEDVAAAADAAESGQLIPSIDRFKLLSPEERSYDANWSTGIDWDNHMRYFSGMEVARLLGFPVATTNIEFESDDDAINNHINNGKTKEGEEGEEGEGEGDKQQKEDTVLSYRKFTFPSKCTMKQQWKMLGNSLNVQVSATVAEIGMQSILPELVSKCR